MSFQWYTIIGNKKSQRHPAAGSSLVSQHPWSSNPQNRAERCFAPYGCLSLAHATVSWVAIAYPISSRTLQAWYPRNHSNPTCRHGPKRTSHSQPGYTHSSRRRPWSASLSPLRPCSFYQNPGWPLRLHQYCPPSNWEVLLLLRSTQD